MMLQLVTDAVISKGYGGAPEQRVASIGTGVE